ncbi:MAG: trypsin-like peptidase domain-containing protein [Roseiflexaceae bacterium]
MSTPDLLNVLSGQMADAVERIRPALVTVNGRARQAASGIVYAPGLVLTADHVVEREDDLSIRSDDGRTLSAQLVGRDAVSDLAVLRVAELTVDLATQSSNLARVGQLALAVGRPTPGGPMASLGIVSAVGGPLRTQRGIVDQVIQTDATPYPGFSGGPLIDPTGAVIGILTTGLIGGAALAIPAAIAWRVASTLAQQGHVKRGFLGISSQPVATNDGQRGLLVVRVERGSPAEQSGLIVGDVLIGMDGQEVADTDDLQALLAGDRVGRAVPAEIIRGGQKHQITITIGQRS